MTKELVKLGIDTAKNKVHGEYSENGKNLEVLREAFVEMNGGSSKLDFKKMRYMNGRPEMFAILEEILQVTVAGGLEENKFFERFVDYRNLSLGDENRFYAEDPSLFVVSEVAEGTQNVERTRLNAGSDYSIQTRLHTIKIYEELNRLLSGRIDFNDMIGKVSKSFERDFANRIYNTFVGNFANLVAPFQIGAIGFDEATMATLIENVEAATGKEAIILSTKSGLRNITSAVVSESMREDYNELGYFGKFLGTDMLEIKQSHIPNTFNFQITNNDIFVVPADIKPVKAVFEGDDIMLMGDPMSNQDLTQEFMYAMRYGIGISMATQYGVYRLA